MSEPIASQSELQQFFADIGYRLELAEMTQRRIDQKLASGFTVFSLIEPDENKLSDIFAWLLDSNESHGQGPLFVELLFEKIGLSATFSVQHATVQREAPTDQILKYRRRIDVLVEAGALVAIENKLDALEQDEQIKDYLEHLRQCVRRRSEPCVLLYLTPNGRRPKSLDSSLVAKYEAQGLLHCWSYQVQFRDWLEASRRACEAEKIRHFLADFLDYIDTTLKRELDTENRTAKP